MKRLLVLCTLASLLLTSCSQNKISKENALIVLQNQFRDNCEQKLSYFTESSSRSFRNMERLVKDLEQRGFLKVSRRQYGNSTQIEYYPTKKGKAFRVNGKIYKVAKASVQEVLGMAHNEDGTTTVRFTYKYETFPLFPIRKNGPFSGGNRDQDCQEGLIEAQATLKPFDDGWRIQ